MNYYTEGTIPVSHKKEQALGSREFSDITTASYSRKPKIAAGIGGSNSFCCYLLHTGDTSHAALQGTLL